MTVIMLQVSRNGTPSPSPAFLVPDKCKSPPAWPKAVTTMCSYTLNTRIPLKLYTIYIIIMYSKSSRYI